MRAKVTGDKTEIRAHYLPSFYPRIVHPLMEDGAVRQFRSHREVLTQRFRLPFQRSLKLWTNTTCRRKIGTLSSSSVWETIQKIGWLKQSALPAKRRSPRSMRVLLSLQGSILTRHFRYNATDHPIAFHRGTDLGPITKIAAKDVPDIEEAFDVSPQLVKSLV